VASIVVTASLSFSAVSHAKDMSSAYSRIHISTSFVGLRELVVYLAADGNAAAAVVVAGK